MGHVWRTSDFGNTNARRKDCPTHFDANAIAFTTVKPTTASLHHHHLITRTVTTTPYPVEQMEDAGNDPYIYSTNDFVGGQIFEFDPTAGTTKELRWKKLVLSRPRCV
ncbi:hypothetical protein ACE6H2_010292 [Prunus campanulata]